MRHFVPPCSAILFLGFLANLASAQNSLSERIDQAITKKADYPKQAAGLSSEAEFLRRVYLDFTGVIPSADEARAFFKDGSPNKRQQLIDRLLASPGNARHMQNVFDVLFME